MVRPYARVRWPMPPPRVSPPTPVVDTMPNGTASPYGWVAASTCPVVHPPPTRTVRCAAVYLDLVQAGQVDNQTVVDAAESRTVVPATAYGDAEAVVAGPVDRRHHVGDIGALGDGQRPFVDHAVVQAADLVVAGVGPPDQPAVQ